MEAGLPDATVKNPENPAIFPSKSGRKSGKIFSIISIRSHSVFQSKYQFPFSKSSEKIFH